MSFKEPKFVHDIKHNIILYIFFKIYFIRKNKTQALRLVKEKRIVIMERVEEDCWFGVTPKELVLMVKILDIKSIGIFKN